MRTYARAPSDPVFSYVSHCYNRKTWTPSKLIVSACLDALQLPHANTATSCMPTHALIYGLNHATHAHANYQTDSKQTQVMIILTLVWIGRRPVWQLPATTTISSSCALSSEPVVRYLNCSIPFPCYYLSQLDLTLDCIYTHGSVANLFCESTLHHRFLLLS